MSDAATEAQGKAKPVGGGYAGVLPGWMASFGGVALTVGLYRALVFVALIVAEPNLGMDNVSDSVWAQALQPVYDLSQPPLYDWLLWLTQQLLGPGPASFLLLKGVILTLAAVFLFGAARHAIRDARLAALAVFGFGLFYDVGWTMVERLTQSSLLLAVCAATAWLFARALSTRRLADHAWLGLALGAGFLTKYNFGLLVAGLVLAALSEPTLRRRLRPSGLALAVVVCVAAMAPFLYGLATGRGSLIETTTVIMRGGLHTPWVVGASKGLVNFAAAVVEYPLPLAVVAAALFWRPLTARLAPDESAPAANARLYGKAGAIIVAVMLVGVVATGSSHLKDWHMLPAYTTPAIWMFARLERAAAPVGRLRLFAWITAGFVALSLAAITAANLAPDRVHCARCVSVTPYAGLAGAIRRDGFSGGTLVALDSYTAGNLRIQFPKARIVMPGFTPPSRASPGGACYVVWQADPAWGARPATLAEAIARVPGQLRLDLAGAGPEVIHAVPWPGQWRAGPGGASTWGVRRLDPKACP